MRAIQIETYEGPEAVRLTEVDEPVDPGEGRYVRISVRAAGVSFPELLQSRGKYQLQPPLPFIPGSEVAGIVESAPEGSAFAAGDRVFAATTTGGFAETVLAPEERTYPLPDDIGFAEGAGVFLNYHTAYFSLVTRGRAVAGETVLIHGAAGGVGTATIQVALALGLRPFAVVSSDEKAMVARDAGAVAVFRSGSGWKDAVLAEMSGGVDLVVDVVGNQTLDSLRAMRETGRLVIVGFASGEIPEIKVNRLLLRNLEVVGAGYGALAASNPAVSVEIARELDALLRSGRIRPLVGRRFPLEQAAQALALIDSRQAVGKVILEIGASSQNT